MVGVLAAAALIVVAAAVIGGRRAESSISAANASGPSVAGGKTADYGDLLEGPAVGPEASRGPAETTAAGGPSSAPGTKPDDLAAERKSAAGATRIGVFNDHFEVGIHAPLTFDGVPLTLAEDPVTGVKGYVTYINRHGGINGLKVRIFPEDDRYTTAGARQSADRLTKEVKPFIIEGALGIDQIHKVATAAKAAGFPYIAG